MRRPHGELSDFDLAGHGGGEHLAPPESVGAQETLGHIEDQA
jgi:hypothetical protein